MKNLKLKTYNLKLRNSFTVVELLMAMSVFAILVTMAVGVFIQGLRSQRLLIYLMAVNNNAGLVLEQMAREIRTGYKFNSSGGSLSFTNFEGENVSYSLAAGRITKNSIHLTAPDANIRYLSFFVNQQQGNICNPWRITIFMEVASRKIGVVQTAPLQTTVSSRVLPVEVPGTAPDDEEIRSQCST
jgi:type II secretory pathway pseudopilin PulG